MMRINGTLVYGRPIKGVVQGTCIPLQELIEKTKTIEYDLLEDYQVTINTIKLPISVRKEINLIIAKRILNPTATLGEIAVYRTAR